MKGWGMSGELIFLLAVIVAIFGIYKYAKSETNDYFETKQAMLAQQTEINELKTKLEKIDEFQKAIDDFATKVEGLGNEVSNFQEYNASIRESVITLREKIAGKQPVIKLQGPVPVEIVGTQPPQYPAPAKKTAAQLKAEKAAAAAAKNKPNPELMKKVKKQVEDLSK